MVADQSGNQRVPSEQAAYLVEGLVRLSSARDACESVLGGHWPANSATARAIAELVASAEMRFAFAEKLAA